MRIEWFSPLPPCRSGIADYSRDIAEHLLRRTEVRFWSFWKGTGPGLPPTLDVQAWNPETSWRAMSGGSIPIYHFGNSGEFHWPMWNLISQRPGIAVLHDGALLGLALDIYRNRLRDDAAFLRLMRQYHGIAGATAARGLWEGTASPIDLSSAFPFRDYVLDRSTAAIVHTRSLLKTLSDECDVPVQYAPLPIARKILDEVKLLPQRQSLGTPLRLVVFGHLAPNRRLNSILRAMSESPHRYKLHLTIAGVVSHPQDLMDAVDRLDLRGQVTLTGFVPDERLGELLSVCDAAINLRFPTMGEASLSQLYLWAFGLPTLVTRTGWYSEQPESTVFAIDPADEINGIMAFFETAFANPDSLLEVGRAGQRWVATEHSPESYAKTVVEFAHHVGSIPAWTIAKRLSGRAARGLSSLRLDAVSSQLTTAIRDLAGLR